MHLGLTITPAWFDLDVVQYRFEASNGEFCGTAHVYDVHDSHRAWADQLAGFPQRASDRRRLTCGAANPQPAGGFADLPFSCTDAAGHAVLEIRLASEGRPSGDPVQSARFQLNITTVDSLRTRPNAAAVTDIARAE